MAASGSSEELSIDARIRAAYLGLSAPYGASN
jgi:hypothetical protein